MLQITSFSVTNHASKGVDKLSVVSNSEAMILLLSFLQSL